MLLALTLLQSSAPSVRSEGPAQVVVEVFGSLLVVDLYVCLNESYASLEAIGSPLSILQVTPQDVYVTVEGGRVSVLSFRQPVCVRLRYVSEAADAGGALRVFYPGRASKMTLVLNLSSAVPVYISPDPSDVYVLRDNSIAIVWLEAVGVRVDYVVLEYPRDRTAPPTLTVAPPSDETDAHRAGSSQTRTPTGQTPTVSYGTGVVGGEPRREDVRALVVLAALVAALAVVALILRRGR